MKGENSKIRILAGVAMLFVTAATIVMVRDFMAQAGSQARVQADAEAARSQADLPTGSSYGGMEAGDEPERTEADHAAVLAYARSYAGEWNVEKYYDGREWKIYEFGKRMAIIAYNFLNDGSYTTGGYKKIVGYNQEKEVTYIAGTDEVVEERVVNSTPIYEYVPLEYHEYHGKDIEYSTPSITISEEGVDMSGMGGPIFSLAMFRIEVIDGQEYLINDDFRFAIVYDGSFLEYCEPDTYGHYQGYYAFD